MLAVLSLDSYNRGYGARVGELSDVNGAALGNLSVINASAVLTDAGGKRLDEPAGFYAIAYNVNGSAVTGMADGTKVISYRGTDNPSLSLSEQSGGSDIANGWASATGTMTAQANLAISFYNQVYKLVMGQDVPSGLLVPSVPTGKIVLTGHSLGGGLAELVSTLTGEAGVGFDWMPSILQALAQNGSASLLDLWSGTFEGEAVKGEALQYVRSGDLVELIAGGLGLLPIAFQNGIAASLGLTSLDSNNPARSLHEMAVKIASYEATVPTTMLDASVSSVANPASAVHQAIDLHSMALAVMLQYAKDKSLNDWRPLGDKLLSSLNNDAIGSAIGLVKGANATTGPASQMMSEIAYSALGNGDGVDPWVTPFGSTAIASLFSDFGLLGSKSPSGLMEGNDFLSMTSLNLATGKVTGVLAGLSEIAVQNAGLQAQAATRDPMTACGAFSANDSGTQISATFGGLWQPDGRVTFNVGLGDVLNTLALDDMEVSAEDLPGEGNEGTPAYKRSVQAIGRADGYLDGRLTGLLVATGGVGSLDGSALSVPNCENYLGSKPGGELLIGKSGSGTVKTNDGDCIVFGGQHVVLGDGNDIVFADSGTADVVMGAGSDTIFGTAKGGVTTLLDYSALSMGPKIWSFVIADSADGIRGDYEILKFDVDLCVFNTSGDAQGSVGATSVDLISGLNRFAFRTGTWLNEKAMPVGTVVSFEGPAITGRVGSTWDGRRSTTTTVVRTAANEIDGAVVYGAQRVYGSNVGGDFEIDTPATGDGQATKVFVGGSGDDRFIIDRSQATQASPDVLIAAGAGGNRVTIENPNNQGRIFLWGDSGDFQLDLEMANGFRALDVCRVISVGMTQEQFEALDTEALDALLQSSGQGAPKDGIFIFNPTLDDTVTVNGVKVSLATTPELLLSGLTAEDPEFGDASLVSVENMTVVPLKHVHPAQQWFNGTLAALFSGRLVSPLAIDLTGDGIQTTALAGSQTFFDMQGTGHAVQTGWLKPTNGFLATANPDGSITGIGNLFGNDGATPNGFAALARLDANADGKIDGSDAAFGSLVVWADLNSDGVAEAGETQTLAQTGIASISLSYTMQAPSWTFGLPGYASYFASAAQGIQQNGNSIRESAVVTMADGSTRQIADVWFATDPMMSQWAWHAPTAAQAALPDLPASGNLTSLQQSYAGDATLEAMAAALVTNGASMTRAQLQDAVEALVFEWAGVANVDPTSRGDYIDARHLGVLEALAGEPFTQTGAYTVDAQGRICPGITAGAQLEHLYQAILSQFAVDIGVQLETGGMPGESAATAAIFGSIAYDPMTGSVVFSGGGSYNLLAGYAAFKTQVDAFLAAGAGFGAMPSSDVVWMEVSNWFDRQPAGFNWQNSESYLTTYNLGSLSAGAGVLDFFKPGAKTIAISGRSDLFVFEKGDGNFTITGNLASDAWPTPESASVNTLLLDDVARSDVALINLNGSIAIKVISTGETISLPGQWTGLGAIQRVVFRDGSVMTAQDITDYFVANPVVFSTPVNGVISTWVGPSVVNGTAGADMITTSGVRDLVNAGPGADTINGGLGADTYIYNIGDGADTIKDFLAADAAKADRIKFGAGITPSMVSVSMTRADRYRGLTGDIILKIADGAANDQITLTNWFAPTAVTGSMIGANTVEFADGTVWAEWRDLMFKAIQSQESAGNDTVYGPAWGCEFDASKGNDAIYGYGSSDTYDFVVGDGQDTVTDTGNFGGPGLGDRINFSPNARDVYVMQGYDPTKPVVRSNVTFSQNGSSLVLRYGASDSITLANWLSSVARNGSSYAAYAAANVIVFSDGSTMSGTEAIAASMIGSAGADTINGVDGSDFIRGGKGNDTLAGDAGVDTYFFSAGDGSDTINDQGVDKAVDKIVFDPASNITAANLKVKQSGIDLVVQYGATDYLTLKGW
ncbi:MAG TPA: calcium-binding protein, partial [Beijerinckiaceae bacterium]|nr:calcium-binding protein [Beijerinckiaceae bacterium]